jgi:dTDP-4-amino-4,6-dideoxygalactose transaminase
MKYNSWPLGKIPSHLLRTELDQVREAGYDWKDPRDVIEMFENKVAEFAGAKCAAAVDCCTHGMFLSLKYLQSIGELDPGSPIEIPAQTYCSAPMLIQQAGNTPVLKQIEWSGLYQLAPTRVYDAAVRWTSGMYVGDNALHVVSFQIKKRIPIGRGGIVLSDDPEAIAWIRRASYDGRNLDTPYDSPEHIQTPGYHFYMTPEDAARGILLMDQITDEGDSGGHENYPPITNYAFAQL